MAGADQDDTALRRKLHHRLLDQLKLVYDPRGAHRRQLLEAHGARILRDGIILKPNYDERRKLHSESEISQDRRRRRLNSSKNSLRKKRGLAVRQKVGANGEKEEETGVDFWEALVRDEVGSVPPPRPTRAPQIRTLKPSPSPTNALLTPRPTLRPTDKAIATATPTVSPKTAAPVAPESPTLSRVTELILSVALSGGEEFLNPGSYQSQSLRWLEGSDSDGLSDDRIIQRYSLGCIYFATYEVETIYTIDQFGEGNVPPWDTSTNWVTDANECEWARIACDDNNFVTILDLVRNSSTASQSQQTEIPRSPKDIAKLIFYLSLDCFGAVQQFFDRRIPVGSSVLERYA